MVRLIAVALIIVLGPAIADALQQQIRFERISVQQGLSDANVTAIIQDQSGFMWIGTGDGLNRYDGYDFIIYRHNPYDPNSLSDNEIRSIVEDDFGNLWIGTRTGLNRLHRGSGKFTRYLHDANNDHSISDNDITVVFEDHESVLWVGTRNGGLNRFNHSNEAFDRFQYDRENLRYSIAQGPIAAIYEDRQQRLWVATRAYNHGALDQFDRSEDVFIHTYGCPDENHGDCNIQQTGDEHRPVATDINGLFQDSRGAFWLATDSGAVEEHKGWLSNYTQLVDDQKSMSDYRVLAPIEDLSGTLWFATRGGGLNRMGPSKIVYWEEVEGSNRFQISSDPSWSSVFDRYQHDSKDPYSLSSDNLTVLYQDRFGIIWIGTGNAGLNKFDPSGMRFGHYKHDSENPNSLSDNGVSSVAESQSGTLWLGTYAGTLNRVDRATGKMTQYWHQKGDPESLPAASIHALHVDKNDVLWIGTWMGLSRFDKASETFQNFNVYPFGPSVHGILSIAEEPAGTLWLGTQASLARFDVATEEFHHIWSDPGNETSLHGDVFDVVTSDRYGKIWVATVNAGINRFDPDTETVTHYRHDQNNINSISDDHITSVMEGADGVMWIGTRNGLDSFDQASNKFTHYGTATGLPDNHIASIVADRLGKMWITTASAGISRYDPRVGIFDNFDVIDGLQGNQFFNHAAHLSNNGEIIISGQNGINAFDPGKITRLSQKPVIAVTELRVGDAIIPVTNEIDFPDHAGEISFKFAALNYANPLRTQYLYKLEGYDEDWVATDASNRIARYQNITAGDYTFRVKARLGNGAWSEDNTSVDFRVVPPLWQSYSAYLAYTIFAFASFALMLRMRTRKLAERAEFLERKILERTREIGENEQLIRHQADHLEELLHVKEKLFTNISHEFRTPLTLILGPVERMLRSTEDKKSARQLTLIRDNSRRLLRLVDQLLGLSRLSAEKPITQSAQPIRPLVNTIVESFQPLAGEKRLQLIASDCEDVWVNCSLDSLEKILLNLVSNAIKYTPDGGWVTVQVSTDDSEVVQLIVSDSGVGIDPKNHSAVFDRFYRVNGGPSTPGAGLGLALVKELAEAAGGSVSLESRLAHGTTITVLLPRHRVRPSETQFVADGVDSGLIPLEIAASATTRSKANGNGIDRTNGKSSILIIEDNLDMQEYLRSLLAESYGCQFAGDGELGLRLALEYIPDLVLCDVMLPRLDGFEVSKSLKANELTSHIPIVMLTARGDHDSRLHGLREHVDDYLTKPFDDEELTLRIANILAAREELKRRYGNQLFDGSNGVQGLGIREQKFLDKLQSVLEINYSDCEFRIDQMSSALAMSDRQLQRKLKALVNHSPAEYLRNYRLNIAIRKLKEGTQVGLVAEAVGFSSQAYFSSCFKAEFDSTPSQFQQQLN